MLFVNIHAVAEGHQRNTFALAVEKARKGKSTAPVIEDPRVDGFAASEIWRQYQPKWSPWTIVIDPAGRLFYNGDTPKAGDDLVDIINKALKKKTAPK